MKSFALGTISKKMAFLVFVAVLPALAIILYSGIEQRRNAIGAAQQDVLLLTNSMAQVQQDITRSCRQILSTLSLLPEVQKLNVKASQAIFSAVIAENPGFHNIALVATDGTVLTSGRIFQPTSLVDRKHVQQALASKDLAAGEYIVTRLGEQAPVFPFAYPVLGDDGQAKAVITLAITLSRYTRFHEQTALPDDSFIAITDHQGLRLFYYPPKATNPVGKAIQTGAWELARNADKEGVFTLTSSDGQRRIFGYQPLRLGPGQQPYLYMWAGIPEAPTLANANDILTRNLLLMLQAALLALFIAWLIGRQQLLLPISSLVNLTRKYAAGELQARIADAGRKDELGDLTRAFHAMADDLSASQAALRDNEARFRLVMDGLDSLVYVTDMQTYEILFINQHLKNIVGDVTGSICWQALQKRQTGPCPFCTNAYLLDSKGEPGQIHTWEFQNTITKRWYYIHDRAIRWVDGRTVRLEIATDITERKKTETNLAAERERLAVTLRSINDGVIATDTEGRITLLNQAAETLTGWTIQESIGRHLDEVYQLQDEKTARPCSSPLIMLQTPGATLDHYQQTQLIDHAGERKNIAQRGAPLKDIDGQVIGLVLVFNDITEQLRTEKELIKIKKLESIGVLAGGIAHDFNNILAAILGNLDLSIRDEQLSEKTLRRLTQAQTASYRARDLTQQLLTFAKGGQPVKKTASLPEVVRESAEFVLRGDKVACNFAFPDDLWLVDIDKGQISQVIQNVIINASQAMPHGGTIQVSGSNFASSEKLNPTLAAGGRSVRLDIEDEGIGIPANVIDRIFDPYFTTKQEGSGLGLAISHSIINKHGGTITVDSTPGSGSRFSIFLPTTQGVTTASEATEAAVASTRSARILVMDDEAAVREIAEEMLKEMGHQVLLADDGLEALQIYKEALQSDQPIDLILLDLTIPGGVGGKDAMEQLLAIDNKVQAIVSSGYSNDPIMANYSDYGFRAAIAKPYQLNDLARTINQLIS